MPTKDANEQPLGCVNPNDKQSVACWIADLLRDDPQLYDLVYLELTNEDAE